MTSGRKYWADGTPVAGQQFEYGLDDIGNRKTTAVGGDQGGVALRPASYVPNLLNQYTSRTVPAFVNVLGAANSNATVTVNNQPTSRKGEYFRSELNVDNTASPLWLSLTNLAVLNNGTNADIVTNITGNAFLPQTPEAFGYDADGNMTNDGRWSFTWDSENRIVSMQAISTVPSGAKKKLDFTYDYQGRRIQKIVSTWNGSAYVVQSTNKFLYDGWNLVAELNSTNGVIRTYLWGLDLSGTGQGAGGVGGLLAIKPATGNPTFVAYDGNGNVMGLIDATMGTTGGDFEYGPFGETLRLTPNANNQSPFRFSTKYTDSESDLVYYGYRYYNPSTGRWLSRDPISEGSGGNLAGFVRNDGINYFDNLGLAPQVQNPNISRFLRSQLDLLNGIEVARTTGLTHVIEAFDTSVLPRITVYYDSSEIKKRKKSEAVYLPEEHTLYFVDGGPRSLDVTMHELAHGFVDLFTSIKAARTDEGVGFVVQDMASAILTGLVPLERSIKMSPDADACSGDDPNSPLHAYVQKNWSKLWTKFGSVGAPGWTGGQYQASDIFHQVTSILRNPFVPFKYNQGDFGNVENIVGLKLKCGDIAKTFNKILESKGCCLRFSCEQSSSEPLTITAGVQIEDTFK